MEQHYVSRRHRPTQPRHASARLAAHSVQRGPAWSSVVHYSPGGTMGRGQVRCCRGSGGADQTERQAGGRSKGARQRLGWCATTRHSRAAKVPRRLRRPSDDEGWVVRTAGAAFDVVLPCDSLEMGLGKGNGIASLRRVTAGALLMRWRLWVGMGLMVAAARGDIVTTRPISRVPRRAKTKARVVHGDPSTPLRCAQGDTLGNSAIASVLTGDPSTPLRCAQGDTLGGTVRMPRPSAALRPRPLCAIVPRLKDTSCAIPAETADA